MHDMVPIFPLGIFVFPGEKINLHIFEKRYKQLIHECLHHQITFGIAPYFEGEDLEYATEVKLDSVTKTHDNGDMDITVEAIGLMKIVDFYLRFPNHLYPGAAIERLPWSNRLDLDGNIQILNMLQKMYDVMKITTVRLENATNFRTYQIAHKVGLSHVQEKEFMLIPTETLRVQYLISHLSTFIPKVIEIEELRKKAQQNGHFKN